MKIMNKELLSTWLAIGLVNKRFKDSKSLHQHNSHSFLTGPLLVQLLPARLLRLLQKHQKEKRLSIHTLKSAVLCLKNEGLLERARKNLSSLFIV